MEEKIETGRRDDDLNEYVYSFANEMFRAGQRAGATSVKSPANPCQGHARQQEAAEAASKIRPEFDHLYADTPSLFDPVSEDEFRQSMGVGLRDCHSSRMKTHEPDPCSYRMRITDPGCTGCADRDEDQSAEAGG